MYFLGDKVDDILSSFQPNNEQSLNSDIVKIRFDKYFTVKKVLFMNELYLINGFRCQINLFISLFYYCIVWRTFQIWSIKSVVDTGSFDCGSCRYDFIRTIADGP